MKNESSTELARYLDLIGVRYGTDIEKECRSRLKGEFGEITTKQASRVLRSILDAQLSAQAKAHSAVMRTPFNS